MTHDKRLTVYLGLHQPGSRSTRPSIQIGGETYETTRRGIGRRDEYQSDDRRSDRGRPLSHARWGGLLQQRPRIKDRQIWYYETGRRRSIPGHEPGLAQLAQNPSRSEEYLLGRPRSSAAEDEQFANTNASWARPGDRLQELGKSSIGVEWLCRSSTRGNFNTSIIRVSTHPILDDYGRTRCMLRYYPAGRQETNRAGGDRRGSTYTETEAAHVSSQRTAISS